MTHTLAIGEIRVERTVFPRRSLDWQTTYRYAQAITAGAKFPPLVVARIDGPVLVDGFHRLEAFKKVGRQKVEVEFLACATLDEAYRESVRRNVAHGKPLSLKEKVDAVTRFRAMGIPEREIAELVAIPEEKLEVYVERPTLALGGPEEGGSVVAAPPEAVGPKPRAGSTQERQRLHGLSQEQLLASLAWLLEKGTLDLSNAKVARLLERVAKILRRMKVSG